MGAEAIIALIGGIITIVTLVLKAMSNRKANRNDLGRVENAELKAGMDKVDAITESPLNPPSVQPVPKQD